MDGAPISARLIDSDELAIADALTSEEAELLGGRSFWARAFETILRYPLAPEQLELEVLRYLQQYATAVRRDDQEATRSEEHTSELQSLMRNSYAVLCLKKKTQ